MLPTRAPTDSDDMTKSKSGMLHIQQESKYIWLTLSFHV